MRLLSILEEIDDLCYCENKIEFWTELAKVLKIYVNGVYDCITNTIKMSLLFGYQEPSVDTEEIEKNISALKTGLATNNEKTKSLETKPTSESTKISTLETKMSTAETDISNIKSTNSSQDTSIQNNWVKGITNEGTATWAKNKANSNASNITNLGSRVTSLEARKKIYTYSFTYGNLGTTYTNPQSKYVLPDYWMHCKGLSRASRFHLHHLIYDADSSLDSNYTFTFQLDFFDSSSNHHTHTLGTVRKGDKALAGENILIIDTRYDLSSVTNLTTLVIGRLKLKGSAAKGNEITVSCSFEI